MVKEKNKINVGDLIMISRMALIIERRNAQENDHWAFEHDLGREIPCLVMEIDGRYAGIGLILMLPDGRRARTHDALHGSSLHVFPDGTLATTSEVL